MDKGIRRTTGGELAIIEEAGSQTNGPVVADVVQSGTLEVGREDDHKDVRSDCWNDRRSREKSRGRDRGRTRNELMHGKRTSAATRDRDGREVTSRRFVEVKMPLTPCRVDLGNEILRKRCGRRHSEVEKTELGPWEQGMQRR